MSYFTTLSLAKYLKFCVYFTVQHISVQGRPMWLETTVLDIIVLTPNSQLKCEHMPAWNILFLCFTESELFSQQLVGVSVMPSCVGCSVRILFASLIIIFRNYHFYYSIFSCNWRVFTVGILSVWNLLKGSLKTHCVSSVTQDRTWRRNR